MSSTQTLSQPSDAPAEAPRSPLSRLFILDGWRDVLLVFGTPFLIVPLFALLSQRMSYADIGIYVATFGALGHHFPGMLRAYGDKELFQRFKTRFIVAPICLAVASIAFALMDLHALRLTVIVWGIWHGLMQTYGFARIYDAKVKSFAPRTQQLDLALCISWFAATVIVSPTRLFRLIHIYHLQIGAPLPSASTIRGIQLAAMGITGLITLAYVANLIVSWRAGHKPSPIKLLLLTTSISFWVFANVVVEDMVIGVAMFEIFHDIQYLAIVWVFNLGRVEKGGAGSFTKFLFRRSGVFVGIYVGLVLAYGSIGLVENGVEAETLRKVLSGFIVASTLLHFYYDGFIWKVREQKTSAALGIEGGSRTNKLILSHAVKWAPLIIGLLFLATIEPQRRKQNFVRLQSVALEMPENGELQRMMGDALRQFGQDDRAIEHYQNAVELGSDTSTTRYWLGALLVSEGRNDEALVHLNEAIEAEPDLADAYVQVGNIKSADKDNEAAADAYERALAIDNEDPEAHHGLALCLALLDRDEEAVEHYEEVVRLNPKSAGTHYNMAGVLVRLERVDEAVEHYAQAGAMFFDQGKREAALKSYRQVLNHRPQDATARERVQTLRSGG